MLIKNNNECNLPAYCIQLIGKPVKHENGMLLSMVDLSFDIFKPLKASIMFIGIEICILFNTAVMTLMTYICR